MRKRKIDSSNMNTWLSDRHIEIIDSECKWGSRILFFCTSKSLDNCIWNFPYMVCLSDMGVFVTDPRDN